MKKKIFGIMTIMLFLVIISSLSVSAVFATEATVVANASNDDCANVTFEVDNENYESYCVEWGQETPETDMVFNVEKNLTSTEVISDEQAQKIKIFAIKYNGTNLSHYKFNKTIPKNYLDDASSKQLIIWYILGQGQGYENWPQNYYVDENIINDINNLYASGLRYDDKGSFPLDNETQFNYTFKYFSAKDGTLQDYLGWFFVVSDIPPQNNETNNTTNETPPPKNETEPPINDTPTEIQKTYTKKVPMTNAAGNPLGLLAFAGLGLGLTFRRRRN